MKDVKIIKLLNEILKILKANEFQEGDLVKLKSGSPTMTIDTITDDGSCWCKWFYHSESKKKHFNKSALIKAEK